jgi:hypothetical protein
MSLLSSGSAKARHQSWLIGEALVSLVAPTNVFGMSAAGALTDVSTQLLRVPIARIMGMQKACEWNMACTFAKLWVVKQEESYA